MIACDGGVLQTYVLIRVVKNREEHNLGSVRLWIDFGLKGGENGSMVISGRVHTPATIFSGSVVATVGSQGNPHEVVLEIETTVSPSTITLHSPTV